MSRITEIPVTADGSSSVYDSSPLRGVDEYTLISLIAATWGGSTEGTLYSSLDKTNWNVVTIGDLTTPVTLTENGSVEVSSGPFYKWIISGYSGTSGMIFQGMNP